MSSRAMPVLTADVLPPTSPFLLDKIRQLEERVLGAPQVAIETHHVLHGGVYSRTICIPRHTVLTGALIKIPTTLVICGDATVLMGDGEEVTVQGYRVLAASANRKQAYIANENTFVTMSFKTKARTIAQAEAEFTDDHERLMSRNGLNHIVITGA